MLRDELLKKRGQLEADIALMQQQLGLIEQLLELTPEESSDYKAVPVDGTPFVGMNNSDAIVAYLGRQKTPVSLFDISRGLLAGGIETKSPRFDTVLLTQLNRLVERGVIEREIYLGGRVYRLGKKKEEPTS